MPLLPISKYRYILILWLCLTQPCYAQYVLNGSFEGYYKPGCGIFNVIGNVFKYGYGDKNNYVEYKYSESGNFGYGSIVKDTTPVCPLVYDNYLMPPPHGRIYVGIETKSAEGYKQLMLLLSKPLIKDKLYSIRLSLGNAYLKDSLKPFDAVTVALSKNNIKYQYELDSITGKDITGWRDYVVSFIAPDTFTYIYLYRKRTFSQEKWRILIDNVRLDTCVTATPKRVVGCVSFPTTLQAQAGGTHYFWNTGDTTQTLTITQSGLYKSYVYDEHGCMNVDSIEVTHKYATPTLTDTSLCLGTAVPILSAKPADTYLWNTGDTSQHIEVPSSNVYWVIRSTNGCINTDTFKIIVANQPTSTTTDTFYCATQSVELTAAPAQTYLWNNGQQTQSITIRSQGLYWVTKNNQQCSGIDSFYVTEKPLPIITSLQDTTVCFDEVARILLDAGTFKSYLWKPTGETTQTIYSTTAQVYLLTVTDSNNCSTSKQVAVMETCPDFVYVPTAFSPNNDGLNDVFLPKTRTVENYELTILNRWGAIIFSTQNPQQGWDGKEAPADVYIAQVRYNTAGKPTTFIKQNITLLR